MKEKSPRATRRYYRVFIKIVFFSKFIATIQLVPWLQTISFMKKTNPFSQAIPELHSYSLAIHFCLLMPQSWLRIQAGRQADNVVCRGCFAQKKKIPSVCFVSFPNLVVIVWSQGQSETDNIHHHDLIWLLVCACVLFVIVCAYERVIVCLDCAYVNMCVCLAIIGS